MSSIEADTTAFPCANLDQLHCTPVLRDVGTEEKRESLYFLTLCEFPGTPGTHIYV